MFTVVHLNIGDFYHVGLIHFGVKRSELNAVRFMYRLQQQKVQSAHTQKR